MSYLPPMVEVLATEIIMRTYIIHRTSHSPIQGGKCKVSTICYLLAHSPESIVLFIHIQGLHLVTRIFQDKLALNTPWQRRNRVMVMKWPPPKPGECQRQQFVIHSKLNSAGHKLCYPWFRSGEHSSVKELSWYPAWGRMSLSGVIQASVPWLVPLHGHRRGHLDSTIALWPACVPSSSPGHFLPMQVQGPRDC